MTDRFSKHQGRLTPTLSLKSAIMVVVCALAGCGGDGFQQGNNDNDGGNGGNDGGGSNTSGSGGASIGVLTDAGAFEVNFTSDFSSSNNINITIDGVESSASELKNGMVANMILDDDDDLPSNLSEGVITDLTVDHVVVGPVTTLNPLRVLGKPVIVTADTELDGISNDDINTLEVGDILRVSGFISPTNDAVLATLVDQQENVANWRLTGNINNLEADTRFEINDLGVVINGATSENCVLRDGRTVTLTATPDDDFTGDGFTTETELDTLTGWECTEFRLANIDSGDEDIITLPAEIEGMITRFTDATSFQIGDQVIQSGSPTYQGGVQEDLKVGVKVEVEGTLNTNTNELTATTIKFHEPRIYFFVPGINVSVDNTNSTVSVLGLSIDTTDLTNDENSILLDANPDITQQIEIQGFVDKDETPYATSVRYRGDDNRENVELQGIVTQASNDRFSILGISVAVSNNNSIEDEDLVFVNGGQVNSNDAEANSVDARNGSFSEIQLPIDEDDDI
ncbi:DUF5666 domain-containing protein [Marinibactrum halimedae]|uniref:DUF5666 domain-containing protein n=1 Tax=Marinibactrum halimedae TaxID=1444977 RepID=A0AA37WLV8_9GAMM|nr:DUF5666 domain-containing protein [Marinibactrum halimedae]MCD9457501.1 DUF5666 domain-containing protein [Marinibactrum halimedae]GLS25445.1 hypothetical protein GCM10007877_11590 [Marinibactrum halimedae]